MSDPIVSIIMAVHNGERFLEVAVQSLIGQTFRQFELIIVDDGSTDSTPDCLHRFARTDSRVRVIRNKGNVGLAASLNRAIEAAQGEFLARFDADDIAAPERLEVQVAQLRADPDLVVVGSNTVLVRENEARYDVTDLPLDDWSIRCTALLQNPFAHPTVMMRSTPFRKFGVRYDESFDTTQDWDLWIRLFEYGRVRNLAQPLVFQRIHGESVSLRKRSRQLDNSLRVQERYVRSFLNDSTWNSDDFRLLNEAFSGDRRQADQLGLDRVRACRIALRLLRHVSGRYPECAVPAFSAAIVRRCVQMGLVPPMRAGWAGLGAELLLRHAPDVLRIAGAEVRKAVFDQGGHVCVV